MKGNSLLLIAFIFCAAPVYSHNKITRASTAAVPAWHGRGGAPVSFLQPTIESILYNPSVYKKQLSRDQIQAVGYREAGQPRFVIHFRKDQLHGEWQSFYGDNKRCDSGGFYRGLPTGEWKTWYPNGQVKTVREYSAEKYQYIRVDLQRNHPKDQRYAITRLGSAGAARYFQPLYESNTDLKRSPAILNRIQHNTSGNAEVYLPPFTTCLHHGVFINYREDGTVSDSGHYENGLRQGLWKEAVNGAAQAVGFYKQGVRQGQWKYYDAKGRLVYTERYNHGKPTEGHYFGS